MYKQCKNRQAIQRQASIAQCLLDMVREVPYREISVCALCQRAQVPRKGFYRYFDSKEDVVSFLLDQAMEEGTRQSWSESFTEHLDAEEYMANWFEYWHSQSALLKLIKQDGLYSTFVQRSLQYMGTLSEGEPEWDLNNLRYARNLFVTSGMMALLLSWDRTGYKESAAEVARQVVNLLHKPLFPL